VSENIVYVSGIITHEEYNIEESLDRAWELRTKTNLLIGKLLSAKIAKTVSANLPNTKTIIVREDTSHLPPHGHVDDILDSDGESLMPKSEDWHDLFWSADVDDDVYDLYDIFSYKFIVEDDGIRRLRIVL
jgi:hypothetical protein